MKRQPGTIFTFYSYKGGTGRSMALANAAWILAANGNRVLTIDWDLEAPGLHRYFRPFLIDSELADTAGLINFFWTYAAQAMTPHKESAQEQQWWDRVIDLGPYTVQLDCEFPDQGCIDLICSGRQDATYPDLVNSFNWSNFYKRLDGALVLEKMRELFKSEYDYVFVDSRTGVSDTSGICTVAMPDKLVTFFTLNRQSVDGVSAVISSVEAQRDRDRLQIYPVVTRVELAEKERLDAARDSTRRRFHEQVAAVGGGDAQRYWSDMEIAYQPYYAYEEMLAAFGDPTGSNRSQTSMLAAMERLVGRITGLKGIKMPFVPDSERRVVLGQFSGTEKEASTDPPTTEREDERRLRATTYLERELGDPIWAAKARARRSRLAGWTLDGTALWAALTVALLMVTRAASWSVTNSLHVMFSWGVGIGLAIPVLQMLGRLPQLRKLVRPMSSVVVLALFLAEGAIQVYANLFYAREFGAEYGISGSPFLLSLAVTLIGIAAQAASTVTALDRRAEAWAETSNVLATEMRRYVHLLAPYSSQDEPGERLAWKRFLETVESQLNAANRVSSLESPRKTLE